MKIFIIDKFLSWIGTKLDGYKTRLGGLGLILYGVVGLLGKLFPDVGLPQLETTTIIELLFGGTAVVGVAGKADKLTEAIKAAPIEKKQILEEKNEIIGADSGGPG